MTIMSKKQEGEVKTDETQKDQSDAEATNDDTNTQEGDAEDTTEADAEGEGSEGDDAEADSKDSDNQTDYDKEIEDEKKRGKPDPKVAVQAFKGRKQKREESADQDDDADRPLTARDIAEVEARIRRETLSGQALEAARRLAGRHANSEKEAQLILARWSNRTFPSSTPLAEQVEEVYAGLHRKKIIGERDEALRGLRNQDGVNRNAAQAHREAAKGSTPKISSLDATAIKEAGFSWNGTARNWQKPLPNGQILVKDPKTGRTSVLPKKKS